MASGVSGWGWNPREYFGVKSLYYSASYLAVLGLHAFIPDLRLNPPGYPEYAWRDPIRASEFRRNINCQVFNDCDSLAKTDDISRKFFDTADSKPLKELSSEMKIPFEDQSLWELSTNSASSWITGLLTNGISLETVTKLKDLGGISSAFGFMFLLLYLTKREPKTDYYHYEQLIFVPPSDESLGQLESKLRDC